MYEIYMSKELGVNNYERLIQYALFKSDTFMLVIYRYSMSSEEKISLPSKEGFEDENEYIDYVNFIKEIEKEKKVNNIVFKKRTEPFLIKLKPYLIKKRNFPTEWPSSRVIVDEKTCIIDICLYRVCNEVKNYLLEPRGLFKWKYPCFPDDLCFFNNGYCWFYIVAHEGYAYMYLKNTEDVEKLRKIGLKFEVTKCNDNEVNLFYEDYNL